MAKRKQKSKASEQEEEKEVVEGEEEDEDELSPSATAAAAAASKPLANNNTSSSDESSSDEEEDLILEGVIVRNPDVSDSDDSSEEEGDDDADNQDEDEPTKQPPAKKQRSDNNKKDSPAEGQKKKDSPTKKKRKKKIKSGPDIVQVDFAFCDMKETFFHGLKALLANSSSIYAANSSGLADLMVENVSVGTVVSTEGDEEGTVFGFASVLNVKTYQDNASIQALKKICIDQCPEDRKKELQIVLSGQTKRPAGFYLHGRMVNLPLEIVEILHQQLVLDMDWAVENAEGGEEKRKSLDFGAFVRIAPSYRSSGEKLFKYFDDEVFQDHAEFSYEIKLPQTPGSEEETQYAMVVVMTKTGHRAAMKALKQLVNGSSAPAIAT